MSVALLWMRDTEPHRQDAGVDVVGQVSGFDTSASGPVSGRDAGVRLSDACDTETAVGQAARDGDCR